MKYDVVVIGGGLAGMTCAEAFLEKNFKVAVISAGRSIHDMDYNKFESNGGTIYLGDKAVEPVLEGSTMKAIITEKLGAGFPLEADVFILSTGKYYSGGIYVSMTDVVEPLLGCDVYFEKDRDKWFKVEFFDSQPFMEFGLETDSKSRPLKGGVPLENVYACGEILKGCSSADKDCESKVTESASKLSQKIIALLGRK